MIANRAKEVELGRFTGKRRAFRDTFGGQNPVNASEKSISNLRRSFFRISLQALALGSLAVASGQTPSALVGKALKIREGVRSARALLVSAQAQASALGAYPTTRLETGFGSRSDLQGGEDLALFQPIDLFGKYRAGMASGRAQVAQAEAALRQEELFVQQEVLMAYAQWASAYRNRKNALAQLDIAGQVQKATSKRVEAKALPEIQLERANLEVEKFSQVVEDRSAALETALIKLTQVVGGELSGGSAAEPQPIQLPEMMVDAFEKVRPELLTLASQTKSSLADAKTARLSKLPDLEFQARRSPWNIGSEQFEIRLQLVFPLWDHGAARQREIAAKNQVLASQLEYEDTKKRVMTEIKSAKIQVETSARSVTSYTKIEKGADDLLKRTRRGYELGANSLWEGLDAEKALYDVRDQLSSAQLDSDSAVASLMAAEGLLLEAGR